LGVENVPVVACGVHMPWLEDHDRALNELCDQRARSHWQTAANGGKTEGPSEYQKHILQRLFDDADGDE